jgi:hypothetical protein
MTLAKRLDELAQRGDAEITFAPEHGQDLEAFQATVSFLRDYERQGYLVIVRSKTESHTGQRYVARVRIKLTPAGIEWRKTNAR